MKTIIENSLNDNNKRNEFFDLITISVNAKDEIGLRKGVQTFLELHSDAHHNFEIGFGHNHMWVHEKHFDKVCNKRLMIVEFPNN